MTKKELLEELKSIPDDTIVCAMADGGPYEITSVAYEDTEVVYFDKENKEQSGLILVL